MKGINAKMKKVDFLVDEDGNKVPVKHIEKDVVKRDKLVNNIIASCLELEELLQETKKDIYKKVTTFLEGVAEGYHKEWKGNACLYNFSKNQAVEIQINKRLEFDERLQIAKQKIDECLEKWSKNSPKELKTIITKAFNVDKKGHVDTKQILQLRKYTFEDPTWKEAMDIIDKSLITTGTKEYINLKVRNEQGQWRRINLNFAAMEVQDV